MNWFTMQTNEKETKKMANNRNPADNLTPEGRSKGGSRSGGNFKNDPQRAAEAGRKGGQRSHGGGRNRNEE